MVSKCPKCDFENVDWEDFCRRCRANLHPRSPYTLSIEEFAFPEDKDAIDALKAIEPIPTLVNKAVDLFQRPVIRNRFLANAKRVDEEAFPEVYSLAKACGKVLCLDIFPEIYVVRSPELNAFTIGREDEPIIVLYSSLTQRMVDGELATVIGHEMGHVKSAHPPYHTLAYLLASGIMSFGVFSTLSIPLQLMLSSWHRDSEITADRASLIVTGNVDVVKRAQIKLRLGLGQTVDDVNLTEFLEQQEKLENSLTSQLAELWMTHPFTTKRIRQLEEFSRSQEYRNIMNKIQQAKIVHCLFCGSRIPKTAVFCPICSRCQR